MDNKESWKFGFSEAEIVSECSTVLKGVEEELNSKMEKTRLKSFGRKKSEKFDQTHFISNLSTDDFEFTQFGNFENHLSGESLNASMMEMSLNVQTGRRKYFDVQQRIENPRFFLIPQVNNNGMFY